MTMGPGLTHPAPATRKITAEDRIERLADLTPVQLADALLWLAGYAPPTFDAVIAAVEPCPANDDGSDDPVPFCEKCRANIGIFLRFGLDWRHCRGTANGGIELFDPGHDPRLAWRMTATAAI
jgi:hypothetical protein